MKENLKKIIKSCFAIALVLSLSVTLSISAYAGQWRYDYSKSMWWYQRDNGSNPAGQWEQIDNVWYYFWDNGYMAIDCQTPDGNWVNGNGAWINTTQQATPKSRGYWHHKMYYGFWYTRADGSNPAGQWEQIDNIWYYFWDDGYMAVDCQTPDGEFVDKTGAWISTNQQATSQSQGYWHYDMYLGYWYERADGSYPASQWEQIDNVWYYFWGDGSMAYDCQTPDGEFVDKTGAWIQGGLQNVAQSNPVTVDEVIDAFYDDRLNGQTLHVHKSGGSIYVDVYDENDSIFGGIETGVYGYQEEGIEMKVAGIGESEGLSLSVIWESRESITRPVVRSSYSEGLDYFVISDRKY